MPRRLPLTLLAALVACPAALGATYRVDPTHAAAVFRISHLGYSYTYGMFRKTGGSVEFDRENPSQAKFTLEADVASLDTMNAPRDEHLLNPDFFNAKEFTKITFVSERVEPAGAEEGKPLYHVTGKLTMLGVTKEVTLPMRLLAEGPTPFGDTRIGFHCETTINRADFGLGQKGGPLSEEVDVTLSFEGVQP